MDLPEREASLPLTQGLILFAAGFGIFATVIALLAQLGLPDSVAAIIFALFILAMAAVAAFAGRTMSLSEFHLAAGRIPPFHNGLALAASFLSATGFLGLASLFLAEGSGGYAVIAGWALGFLALALFTAPGFRRARVVTIADFLALRYGDSTVRTVAAVITILVTFTLLSAALWIGGYVIAALLDTGIEAGIAIMALAVLVGPLLGGLRAITLTGMACAVVLLIAFLAPLVILSLDAYGTPLPFLAYGRALRDLAMIGGDSGSLTIVPGSLLPVGEPGGFAMAAIVLSLAAGIASMPHLVTRCAAARGTGAARQSVGWALVFLLLVFASAPAYGIFARLTFLSDPSLSGMEADALVMALPAIAELPAAMSALAAAGALAAILAAGAALLFVIGQTLGHDLYAGLLRRHPSASRQMIAIRLFLVATASIAAWSAMRLGDAILSPGAAAFALAGSALFPPLFLGIWWKRANAAGALAGMAAGFLIAVLYIYATTVLGMGEWHLFGGSGLPPMAAGLFGLPAGLAATILVSLATAEPSEETRAIVAAIRSSAPNPLLDDRGI